MINHAHSPGAFIRRALAWWLRALGAMNCAPTDAKSALQLPFERLVQYGGQQGIQFGGGLRLQKFLVRVGLRGGAEGPAFPVIWPVRREDCAGGLMALVPQRRRYGTWLTARLKEQKAAQETIAQNWHFSEHGFEPQHWSLEWNVSCL